MVGLEWTDSFQASNDAISNHPVVYNAAAFYGHNECESRLYPHYPISHHILRSSDDLKQFTFPDYDFGRIYLAAYDEHCPISAPEEDRDDRLALYALEMWALALLNTIPSLRLELID